MAHAIIPCELNDPDFSWLLNNFLEEHPDSISIQIGNLPVILLTGDVSLEKKCESESEDFDNPNIEDFFDINPELAEILKSQNEK